MTSTPPRGQGWAAIRSRIASTPAIVTTSSDMSRRRATTQRKACAMPMSVPAVLAAWMRPFAASFTNAVWRHVLVLVAGVVLAPGRRTVTGALRVMGLDQGAGFAVYHRVLSLGRWSSRAIAHRLLLLLVAALVPQGPVVIGLDDTIERRWGAKIKARGIYRDPVRSSHGHVVKASGLRWLCVMLLAPVPYASRVWALPFLTVLAPSARYHQERGRRHKTLLDWGRQTLLQLRRWLPGRRIVAVTGTSFAALEAPRSRAPAGRCHHPSAPRRQSLRAGAAAAAGPDRPAAAQGRTGAEARAAPRPRRHALAGGRRAGLVRRGRGRGRHRLGRRRRVPGRPAGRADPLGPGARSRGQVQAAGLPVHRRDGRSDADPAVVRPALAPRGHLRGRTPAPRRRDAAAVVGQGDHAHHAGAAGALLAGRPLGR